MKMTRPERKGFSGTYNQIAEFNKGGSFIRGSTFGDTAFNPTGSNWYTRKSNVGETYKELFKNIQVTSPENLADMKKRNLESFRTNLELLQAKKKLIETRVQETRGKIIVILQEEADVEKALDIILDKEYLTYPFDSDVSDIERDIKVVEKDIETWQ